MGKISLSYDKIPFLKTLENKTTPLLRPAFFVFFLLFYIAPDTGVWGEGGGGGGGGEQRGIRIFSYFSMKTYVVGTH